MTVLQAPKDIASLSLITLKCAPNIFDLSSDMSHASIRDQIVRAQLLVRDLAATSARPSNVLVVGAGFAGVAAALACVEHGISVQVVEVNDQPFSLQIGVHERFVGPFMYEWPAKGFNSQNYPPVTTGVSSYANLRWLSAIPLSAHALAVGQQQQLAHGMAVDGSLNGKLSIWVNVSPTEVRAFVRGFKATAPYFGSLPSSTRFRTLHLSSGEEWPQVIPGQLKIDIDAVILAGGLGSEQASLRPLPADIPIQKPPYRFVRGIPFWKDDGWLQRSADDHVGVFGAGDGALQDVLRALTGDRHPLDTIDRLKAYPAANNAIVMVEPELIRIEQDARLHATWTQASIAWTVFAAPKIQPMPNVTLNDVYAEADRRCRKLAEQVAATAGVVPCVAAVLRQGAGSVVHVSRETSFTKAYMLNRFLVHLIDLAQKGRRLPGCVRYCRFAGKAVSGGRDDTPQGKYVIKLDKHGRLFQFDRIAIRHGVMGGFTPGRQLLALTPQAIAERATLGKVPWPMTASW